MWPSKTMWPAKCIGGPRKYLIFGTDNALTCGISSTRKPCGREKVGDLRKTGGPRKPVIFGTDSTP